MPNHAELDPVGLPRLRHDIGAVPQPAPDTNLVDGFARAVAQVSNLLYRGFPIRWLRGWRTRLKVRMRCLSRTPSRLEVGDTAGWKPALPVYAENTEDAVNLVVKIAG